MQKQQPVTSKIPVTPRTPNAGSMRMSPKDKAAWVGQAGNDMDEHYVEVEEHREEVFGRELIKDYRKYVAGRLTDIKQNLKEADLQRGREKHAYDPLVSV